VISRRQFIAGTSALAIGAALFNVAGLGQALAQQASVSMDALLKPGPLEEHAQGSENAPVTIVEYASMTCSHCATFHNQTYPELRKRYIETGKVRYILREFPFDPLAAGAFMLARCAGADRYHPMIQTLFSQQQQWVVQKPIDPLFAIARQAGFSREKFDACLSDQKMLNAIEEVRNRGAKEFGVNSTPTFFINGQRFSGAMSIEQMAEVIDPLIKS